MHIKQILVVGPAWVGDMVMSQSLYQALAQKIPGVAIDVLAPKHSGPLVARMPEVRHFIELPLGHGVLDLRRRFSIAQDLRTRGYDWAIVLPNSFKSALIPWMAGIPLRTGWRGEWRYGLLNDIRALDPVKYPRMVHRFVALAFQRDAALVDCPVPQLSIRPQDLAKTCQALSIQKTDQKVLALCPGAEYGPAKRWPAAYFGEIAKRFIEQGGAVWILGSPKEKDLAQVIQGECAGRARDFVGETTLEQAIDLLSLSDQVLSNDSGLMHVAAALDKPMLALYGSSSETFTPPLGKQVHILNLHLSCSPCFARECPLGHFKCMMDMTPEYVWQALEQLGPFGK